MTLALIPWLDPEYAPAKPFEAASATLDRPHPGYPETTANPSTKMSQAPNRPLWIDRLLQ